MIATRHMTLTAFIILLSLTMVGEGMITVTLLWTSASIGQSPMFIGLVLFIMNIVPFLAQYLFEPLRRAIEDNPVHMIVVPRILGVAVAAFAGATFDSTGLISLILVASCLTFITFISQQCIETLMGQLTVAGVLDAQTSARLSQTALQTGVFVGNALAGLIIAGLGTGYVFYGIAVSFASSILLLFVAPTWTRPAVAQAKPSLAALEVSAHKSFDPSLWILLGGMGFLAIQLSGFNFFVPLIYEGRPGHSAAVYGIISAAAGVGALVATFVRSTARSYFGYVACAAVVLGDIMVTQLTAFIPTLIFAFGIGFGFNTSRIHIRQAIFERLTSKSDSALWAARVTLAFRGMTAGAPLVFGLMLVDRSVSDNTWLFSMVGVLAMGILVPVALFLARQRQAVPSSA
ncbi:hypothetical protein ACQKKX_06435 [Neorhizobium sp. NPDC001467]|uniref:hypothetical protein n=1 Tax=Neorhizobium sp. NPDC001467 TaxID=3390595 RepID=UPI003CFFCB19